MRRVRRGHDWALGLAPQELADRHEGLVFAAICVLAVVLVGTSDLLAPRHGTVGSIALLPVAAAGWLLSKRLAALVVAVAMATAVATGVLGAVHPITAATAAILVPALAMLTRFAATSVLDSRRKDETARRARAAADQARELERAKSQFLRVASHELRGPLAILRGYLDLMSDRSLGTPPPAMAAVLPRLAATASSMNHTVDQMLDAARLEDSRLQLQPRSADLAATVREVAGTMRLLHGASHEITLRNSDDPMKLEFDEPRIATVLGNLVSNAMKYSAAGTPVTVVLERIPDRVFVHVSDEGVGIAGEDLGRLFTRFGRIVTSQTREVPGTGLGLYLSRELARLHGGDITVVSCPGAGSTFSLSLPAAARAAAAPVARC